MATYKSTFSAGSKKVSVGNDVITFNNSDGSTANIQYLSFQTFDQPCSIQINGESTLHWIDSNNEFTISDMYISKVKIIDSGVSYYFTALSID